MSATILENFASQKWIKGKGKLADVQSAVTGDVVAQTSSGGLDFKEMADYARNVGGPALRKMTLHERAFMVKDLGLALTERKEELYALNSHTKMEHGWANMFIPP